MNKLIIIGNGFDLHHGLPTSYGSFIKWLVKQNLEKVFTNEQGDDELFVIKKESLYGTDISPYNLQTLDEIIELLLQNQTEKEGTVVNSNFQLFKCGLHPHGKFATEIIENMRTHNWVDIEMEYFRQLTVILKSYNQENTIRDKAINELDTLNRNLTYLIQKLRDYLTEVVGNKKANEHFGNIAGDPIQSNIIQDQHHLKRLQNDDYDDPENKRFIKPGEVLFLNFNYTTLPNKLFDRNKNFNYINIHGTIDNKNTPPTFGFGDEVGEEYADMEKTNDNRFLMFAKSFAYSQNGNYSELVKFIESDSFCVYIWGHSCGLSDRTLLNMIFEHNNCAAIQPFYWKRADGTDNFTEIIQNLSRHFKNKQKFRNRLVHKKECIPL
ncbi:Bacteriophage abortive infection AbiH [bacterium A37T11]|nr:Bacteriophage abortive infection AbiH [bacterium A37T11]